MNSPYMAEGLGADLRPGSRIAVQLTSGELVYQTITGIKTSTGDYTPPHPNRGAHASSAR